MSAARLIACLILAALLLSLGISTLVVPTGVASAIPLQTATPTLIPGTGAVVGITWDDTDGDGFRDPDELPLPGMLVTAQSGQVSATATSAVDGSYRVIGLLPGDYVLTAAPPYGYEMTTPARLDVRVTVGVALGIDFGARFVPTPTPTSTVPPILDVQDIERAYCGGVYRGDTSLTGHSNVSRYGCRPAWDESGPEIVFRVELDARQPLSATLLSSAGDLDLFLLRYAYPDSCVAAGDSYLAHTAEPGVYYLAVDGYRGVAGAFALRVDCPIGTQASPTPTHTPSLTPSPTPTHTPAPTSPPTPTATPRHLYLPAILHAIAESEPVTVAFQHGVDGYFGGADTTLSSWYETRNYGAVPTLRLSYARPPAATTQMAPVLRFDVGALPSAAQIRAARLRLYLVSTTKDVDLRGRAHGLLQVWDEARATWLERSAGQAWAAPGAQAVGQDHSEWSSAAQRIQETQRWYDFDVTEPVRQWVGNPARNDGLILLAQAGDDDSNVTADFASREDSTPALRPQLVITYALPLSASLP